MPREKVLELLTMIDRRVLEMSDRIETIIAACHLDAGDLHVYVEPVPAAAILRRVADPERPAGNPLTVAPADADLTVAADFERSLQVLRELVANAQRYSPPGTPIELWVDRGERSAAFVVADRGPGLDGARGEDAFKPLWHGDDGGSGLGLYVARGLARAMDGDLTHRPRPGGGSEFSFSLRVDGADDA